MTQYSDKIKTLLSLLGGFVVVIQIYSWWSEPKANITATISSYDRVFPKSMAEHFSRESSQSKVDTLTRILSREVNEQLAVQADVILRRRIPEIFAIDSLHAILKEFNNLTTINIENSGSKEIKDIEVFLGSASVKCYEFSDMSGRMYSGIGKGKIKIGDMRPSERIEVRLWSLFLFDGAEMRVTYSDGVITPDRTIATTGIYASLISFFPNIWIMILFLIVIMFLPVTYMLDYTYRKGYNKGLNTTSYQVSQESQNNISESNGAT